MLVMEAFKGVHILPGFGTDSNIYVIDSEIIVDTGTGEYFHEYRKIIEKAIDVTRLKMVINTHYHYDHTGGNKKFRDWLKIPIAIHRADREFVERGRTLSETFHQVAKIVTVDKELEDGDTIETENFQLEVIHTPGHSSGSICLYDKERKMLISGDTLFEDTVGRNDLPGGNYNEMRFSLEKLDKLNIQYMFPGHGNFKAGGINFLIKKLLVSMETSAMI